MSAQTLFVATPDGEVFALVRAFDVVGAADLAFGPYALQWFGFDPANDHHWQAPEVAAAKHRSRFGARLPTDAERHRFAAETQRLLGGGTALAACIVTEEFGALAYERQEE